MQNKESILIISNNLQFNRNLQEQKNKESAIKLPKNMLRNKDLSEEDENKIKKQWKLLHDLSLIELPNDIRLRQQVGLPELAEGTLVHGTAFDIQKLAEIKRNGVISGEFLGIPEDGETNYCADFFRVPRDISVQDYISWSHEKESPIEESRLSQKRMESRYLVGKNNQVTVIINTQNKEIGGLLDMEAYTNGYDKMKTITIQLKGEKRNAMIFDN